MIKDFLLFTPGLCIKNANCVPKNSGKLFLNNSDISVFKCLQKFSHRLCIMENCIVKPFSDLKDINIPYLFVWNNQMTNIPLWLSLLCKITSCKQNTPKIIYTVVYLIISQFCSDSFHNRLPGNQTLNLIPSSFIRFGNKSFYKVITTGIDPI